MQIGNMLSFFARLSLPELPGFAADLMPKLDMLPEPEVVQNTAAMVQTHAASFRSSMSLMPTIPAIIPRLEALGALRQMLAMAMNSLPATGCVACRFAA